MPAVARCSRMSELRFQPLVLIPVYNHEGAIGDVVRNVLAHGQHCLLVDDGSSPACAAVLDERRHAKYWPPVGRVDNVYGDRNLFCSCVQMSAYE